MDKTYIGYVSELIEKQKIGNPIYTKELAKFVAAAYDIPIEKAAGAVSVACKRIMDGKMISALRFYQKGIYYLTIETPFGETSIDKEQLIDDKYLKNDTGYETGMTVLHKLGLTTQMPNERVLATNKATDCARIDKKLGVIVRPPKVEVNAENKLYLKVLDVLDSFDNAPIDAEYPYKIIGDYIKQLGLEYVKLLGLADNYYNRNTILQLAHVAGDQL